MLGSGPSHLEPNARAGGARHAPALGEQLEQLEPEATDGPAVRRSPGDDAGSAGVLDLDADRLGTEVDAHAHHVAVAEPAVQQAVAHELAAQQLRVADDP